MRRQRKNIHRIAALALLLGLSLGTLLPGQLFPRLALSAQEPSSVASSTEQFQAIDAPEFVTVKSFLAHDDGYVINQSFDSPIGTIELLTGDFAEALPFEGDLPEVKKDEVYFYFRAKFTNEQHIPLDISMLFAYLFIEDPAADPEVPTPLYEASLYAIDEEQLASEGHLIHSGESLDGLFVLTLPRDEVPADPLRLRMYFANGRTQTVCRLGSVCDGLTDELFELSRQD